jgi:hypothetical protein
MRASLNECNVATDIAAFVNGNATGTDIPGPLLTLTTHVCTHRQRRAHTRVHRQTVAMIVAHGAVHETPV